MTDAFSAPQSTESEPDPRHAPFGYFGTDQLGVGMFRWSANAQEGLARYMHEDLLAGLLDSDDRIEAVATLYGTWQPAGVGLSDVVDRLNDVTGDESTIVWCGSFDELRAGAGEFAREVREAWRESRVGCGEPVPLAEGETIDGPVADGDLDAFVEFLEEYGF